MRLTTRYLLTLAAWTLLAIASPTRADERPSDTPAFDIWEYQIEGNSVLLPATIEQAVQERLGPGRSMKDVEAARDALEAAYQKAGYLTVLVDIPEQRIDEGVVRLSVIEGRVGHLYVSGSKYHDQGFIRERVAQLAPGTVPDFNQVQQQLGQLNRGEDRRVQPVLKPGRLPGTVDVDLQVDDKLPLSGNVELNNNHARDTDDLRLAATLRYDNLFQLEHSVSLTLLTAPTHSDQSRVAVLNYGIPLDDGGSFGASITWSDSDLETLGSTQVLSSGTTFGLRRHFSYTHAGGSALFSLGADYKNLKEKADLSTPLRYLPFQLAYADQWAAGTTQVQLNLGVTAAVGALLHRSITCPSQVDPGLKTEQFACKRFGASPSFGAFHADGHWQDELPGWGQWRARLAGQVASGPLVSAEQFAVGGADTVRGYLDSEATGDHAWLASLEWRGPNLAPADTLGWRSAVPLLFADAATVYTLQALPGQPGAVHLIGTGLGLRLSSEFLEASLDIARAARAAGATAEGQWRAHARVVARF